MIIRVDADSLIVLSFLQSTSAILMENMDLYMLNPCSNKIWWVHWRTLIQDCLLHSLNVLASFIQMYLLKKTHSVSLSPGLW